MILNRFFFHKSFFDVFFFSIKDAVFFSCGDNLKSKGMTYLTNSLFDYRSPENNGVKAEFILDSANHKVSRTSLW